MDHVLLFPAGLKVHWGFCIVRTQARQAREERDEARELAGGASNLVRRLENEIRMLKGKLQRTSFTGLSREIGPWALILTALARPGVELGTHCWCHKS
jgi:hypothetical protein